MIEKISCDITVREEKVQKAIAVSKAAFLAGEAERKVSQVEFLFLQSKLIQKRWWFLQGGLLLLVGLFLNQMEMDYMIRRALGLAGPLFVILILPELWKNRNFDAVEVECTTYYTIRSIYAARLVLFAGVDILLLSVFLVGTALFVKITLWEILIQFLLPFNVTCVICFRTLYSKRIRSETLALLLCILWTGLWSILIMSEAVYPVISVPMWIAALVGSILGICCTISRGSNKWNHVLEVKPLWI